MRFSALSTGLLALLVGCRGGGGGDGADLILVGGRVWTGTSTEADPLAGPTAVAIRGGRIVGVGTDQEVEAMGPGARRIELAGRRVIAGFIDNHTHFISGGFELDGVQLRDAASPAEFSRRIGAFADERPGEWITGGTWDHELWGGELPRRDWIDSLTGDTPVFVSRLDGHMALANTVALELAGVTTDTPDPPGGEIVRYPDGRPSGILKDAAQDLVFRVIPQPSDAARDRAFATAAAHAVSRGVTLVTDMGNWSSLATYRRALERGALPLRVYAAVPLADWARMADYVEENGRGDEWVAWGAVKGFADGSLGSTTAWFYEPYDDAPGTAGFMVVPDSAEFRRQILAADAAGLHVMIHAIGDRANDWVLDAFADAVQHNGPRDRRFRIEHAQHLTPTAIERFARDSVIASMQPYHAIDDGRWAEKRIGSVRIRTTYAFRDLLDAGARVTFGSDWTVAPIDPLLGIYGAVTRRTIDGANPKGWVPEQKITVAEAVNAYTRANAYGNFRESDLGTISEGRLADLVVLSDDIFAIPPEEIETVRVDMTMIAGEVVFER